MNTLATLQQRFQIHVTSSPDAAADGLQDDVRGHLEVYVNAYWGRLREALADNYPVLNRALGDDGFRELAAAYVSAHPSHFRSIRWFGDRLADFIAGNPEIVPHPALLDIARLDWAMRGAFDAADATPLRFEDLVGIPSGQWPGLRLALCPSFRMLALDWGIEALWHALNADENAETDEPQRHAHMMIVWRAGLEIRWRTVAEDEALALRTLADGGSFADLCAAIDANGGGDATAVATLLGQWISEGLLSCPSQLRPSS
ncbi:MAG: putative DNA-binding domain-containing protein [Rhodocyclaceae bacterium]|jgi:hypothetical protein|nr:putative DNA-binding domain-containing protein [Rhodocyclaceae bacterium]MBK6675377.1 putative DNA-binding domain-containing protein [Rhodocyclaceae bacterium]MBK9311112.1 putative DNA-binding domain-containing protein [Rhodocyclaceae bacterium]MBK9956667.1 putative DNA-binding domain-containing protein [Rhodocyclaceae bacterium]